MMECCGTCEYHKHDYKLGEWVCTNKESEYYAYYIEYSDKCEEYEERYGA